MKKIKNKAIGKVVTKLLKDIGGDIYLYHVSQYDSSYLKFRDPGMKSIRIGDHNGRAKYKYTWNVDIGGITKIEWDRNVQRFYYSEDNVDQLVTLILKYRAELKESRAFCSSLISKMRTV